MTALRAMGVDLNRVRSETIRLLNKQTEDREPRDRWG
jgi:hypothetical protein